jgi:hypothetical protein
MSVLVLAALLLWVGSRVGGSLVGPGQGRAYRVVLYEVAGLVTLYLLQMALDLVGIRWTGWSIGVGLLLIGGVGEIVRRRRDRAARTGEFPPGSSTAAESSRFPSDFGWGDGVAAGALGVFALFAPTLWVTTPDWAYHWGLKAHRYFLAGGVDLALLTRPWNGPLHPDYPNLLPDLYAATAALAGRFAEPPLMLWSVVFFTLLLVAARELLRQEGVDRAARQATIALLALLVGGFALRQLAAGGADWSLGLALLLAVPALLGAPEPATERQLGLAAAFAAGSKLEGVALAAAMIAVLWLWRGRRLTAGVVWRTAALPAAVVLPWLAVALRYHLFLDYTGGGPQLAHLRPVAGALLETLASSDWSGLAAAVALPLPLLASRRARPFAAVACLQLLFYGCVYLSALSDQRFYVLSTFSRLALHVIPAALVVTAAVLWGDSRRASCTGSRLTPSPPRPAARISRTTLLLRRRRASRADGVFPALLMVIPYYARPRSSQPRPRSSAHGRQHRAPPHE